MSGGILLPGTATAADVRSGKTFSSSAGLDVAGTLAAPAAHTSGLFNILPYSPSSPASQAFDVFQPVSGQPLVVMASAQIYNVSSIVDTFSTTYTWTKVESTSGLNSEMEVWVGTGGSGNYGAVTVTYSGSSAGANLAAVIPCMGCSTGSGLAIVDKYNDNGANSGTTLTPGSITTTQQDLIIAAYAADNGGGELTGWPSQPWMYAANYGQYGVLQFGVVVLQQAAAGTYNPSVTSDSSGDYWASAIVAII